MNVFKFSVPEPLCGFIVRAQPWSKIAKRYVAYKDGVRLMANVVGIPDAIPEGQQAIITLTIYWRKRARIDCSNILKALEDAIFIKDRGISEAHVVRIQHTGNERMEVTVRFEGEA